MSEKGEVSIEQKAYWCVVSGSDVWLQAGELPIGTAKQFGFDIEKCICIGEFNALPVIWLNDQDVEKQLPLTSLRECLGFSEPLFLLISKAVQYGHMSQSMRFCPQCGGRNHLNHNQLAMQCGECRTLHYPRIFPCIIVAVRKDDQILLAQHPRHRNGMYTVIAGFLEVGETLEQCVAREVLEETGIVVTNIRYFGSQPWAFPSSMMMGFLADYHSGNVKPDYTELSDAQWFTPNNMPPVAPEGTIARALIEQTLDDIKTTSH
ncbi:NADH pyrophosphatase [Vibrio ponticus]|uniref:NAD-capped RNA hydrolase NudC n=1 Tax=Vibrio ponticus TaxID=265668 RepID=A0A3N3E3Y2_9VIBR|nr:NAD(+) diphosphatase [Vibrio ponticus]OLQ87359.1 NADH pyrophosphatase [Vibrio ponticus]ROV61309.1 NAD(+) diphosphatase [Vibrio ponticus]